jgi:hypothetical protein
LAVCYEKATKRIERARPLGTEPPACHGVKLSIDQGERSIFAHPRYITVELLAERNGRLEEAEPSRRSVQIQLIPRRATFEASVDV